ncbi:iron-containing alcohol dehydrogenase [Trametes polyzona]|nr:iron-containing alcohol dehydrogenase [Trametes polyzona]
MAPSDDIYNSQGSYAWSDTLRRVYYGPGCVKTSLPKLLTLLGGKKAFVVTGHSLHDKTNVVKQIEDILKAHNAYGATFFDIGQHAPIADIKKGLQRLKDVGADIVVSVGGGSPIDSGKMIVYLQQQESDGGFLKHIAIPTTLSAAEYTPAAGYTNEDGHKKLIGSPSIPPAGIILDAELTLSTPEKLWLSTGMRAVDHAVETLYRPFIPPPVKHLAYAALSDLFKYLPLSKADPEDVAIRQKLQFASWMSLWPIAQEEKSAFGLSHALGHSLGARYNIPHGITSCLTLAPVVALKAESASHQEKEWLAGALAHIRRPSSGSLRDVILTLSTDIQKLVDDLGLHSTLAEYKVPREEIPTIAKLSVKESPADMALLDKVAPMLESIYS